MKKQLISLLILLMGSGYIYGQENIFNIGDKVMNFGIGFGSTLYSGTGYKTSVPPVSVSFEKGIIDEVLEKGVIGIGGYLAYAANKWEYLDWGYRYSRLILAARGVFHYPLVDNFDTYTGIHLGYQVVRVKDIGNVNPLFNYNVSSSGVIWSWFAGARYYFSEDWAAFGEVGYGITYLNLGVAKRF